MGAHMTAQSPFDASGAQFAWDSTSIKLAETCLRKYEYKMLQGWQPQRKSVHLLFGGWYASALENYYKAVADGVSAEQALLDIVHETLIATWEYPDCETCEGKGKIKLSSEEIAKRWPGESVDWAEDDCEICDCTGKLQEGGAPWQSDHNTKTRENLIRTIVWYLDCFGEDDSCQTIILSTGAPAVEHSFKLPVDNGIVLAGHLDRLVEYGGKPYVQDQKTTGSTITPRFFEQFSPDTQMSLYTFAGKAIFNVPVKGVMIDGAQIAVGFTRFERGFTFRDDSQLDEWYDGAMRLIESTRKATQEAVLPMNPSACNNFGGCEFRNICSRAPAFREQFLRADFAKGKIWNPLEAR